jgi:hypothetical protein
MANKKLDLSIIIVNYNTSKLTMGCIESVKKSIKNLDYEIIVVNNSDKPEQSKILHQNQPNDVKIIDSKNRGFGTANNSGAKAAKGEYLLLLNSDIKVSDNSIFLMFKFLTKHQEIAALSPLLYQEDGKTLQKHFFGSFPTFGSLTFRRWRGREANLSVEYFYSNMISAAAMMIKRSIYNQMGGFDQNFFMYCEDDDLCRRLMKAGYKNAVLTGAKIIHLEGSSSTTNKKRLRMYYKSQSYYWQKHNGTSARVLMEIIRWPYKTLNILISK